jgi:hypothetical protein
MLIKHLINNYFAAYKDKHYFQTDYLIRVQNTYAICTLSYVMVCLYNYYANNDYGSIISSFHLLCYYVTFDFLLCEKLIYFHHSLCVIMGYVYFNNLQLTYASQNCVVCILSTEISTFFLTIRAILEDYKRVNKCLMITYNVNNVIFTGTFMYTRLYMYINALRTDEFKNLLSSLSYLDSILFQICLFSLLVLNLYWARLIMKSILRINSGTKKQITHSNLVT